MTIETLNAEIDEAADLSRPHFPNDDELTLRRRAEAWRQYRYEKGRWPDVANVAREEAKAAAAADA